MKKICLMVTGLALLSGATMAATGADFDTEAKAATAAPVMPAVPAMPQMPSGSMPPLGAMPDMCQFKLKSDKLMILPCDFDGMTKLKKASIDDMQKNLPSAPPPPPPPLPVSGSMMPQMPAAMPQGK